MNRLKELANVITAYELGTIVALNRAIAKHGIQSDITIDRQYAILVEEFMKLTELINGKKWDKAVDGVHKVSAMLVKLLKLISEVEE